MITLIIFAVIFALLCLREIIGLGSPFSDSLDIILVLGWACACTITIRFIFYIRSHP